MTQPVTAKFGKVRILLGDGSSPQVYTAPCGLTSKSINFQKGLADVNIPDCDDPDAIAWVGRDSISLSCAVSGEGVLAEESAESWLDAQESADSVPVKLEIEFTTKTITWTGFMQVETFNIAAAQGGRATANVNMQSDGEMTRVVTP